ncbi:MAG: rhomboid family intramembrane serine protease [Cyclobacteriaceae bacterium]
MMNNAGIFDDFKNAWDKPNNGLIQIILINVIVFVALIVLKVVLVLSGLSGVYESFRNYLMLPADFTSFIFQPWSLITYFFTHEGFLHIIFNMLFLFWFGRLIQDFLGNNRLISLYVIGGIMGGLFYMLMYNVVPFYHDRIDGSLMLGASAGVFAVVVGAATFMPNHTFFLLFLGAVRIKYIAMFYVLLSLSRTIGSNAGGELAHIGGAIIGFLFIKQLQKGNDLGAPVIQTMDFFKGLFKPSPKIKVTHKKASGSTRKAASSSTTSSSGGTDQAEIDAILDKISEKGYESLSKEEKQKLFNASRK